MLPGGAGRRNAATLLVTFLLLVSCFGPATGATTPAPTGAPDTSRLAGSSQGEPTAASQSGTGVVHPDLRDVSGEVSVVVRFPELEDAHRNTRSSSERGGRLRSHAAATQTAFEEFVARHPGVSVERSFWVANAKLVTVDTDAVDLQELAAVDGVREVHPNYRVRATSAATAAHATGATALAATGTNGSEATGTNGTATGGDRRATYGIEMVRAPEVWERFGTRGAGVSVAVLDSGVDPSHPDVDLPAERWAEFDDEGDRVGSTPYDSDDHGTHTSATVAGGDASGTHVGVAPEATLYHGKVLDGDFGTWAAIIAGIEWAATEAEVDVVSMSLGSETYYPAFVEPIRRANDLGVVVVASAGNNGEGASNSPGNLYDTVAVGAVDRNRTVASSSGGERVETADAWGAAAPAHWPDEYVVPDVTAPGVDVRSAVPGGGYATKSGTSMAVPHVAGVVALIRAAGGDHHSPAAVRDLLARTARTPAGAPPSKDTRYGAGVVDAYTATARATADSTVTGRVLEPDGDPVAGSRVETEFGYGTTTDADGTYRLDVPSLEQTLTVEAFGYETETVAVAPESETRRRDVVLSNPTLDTERNVERESGAGPDGGADATERDGAGGSGGVGDESSDPARPDDELDASVETAAIVDADPARPGVTVPLANSTVTAITFADANATGTLTVREGIGDDLAAPPGTTVAALSIAVPERLADRPATVRATVPAAAVDGDRPTLYRHVDGTWRPLETTVTRAGGSLVVEAETSGLSRFAIVRDGAGSGSDDAATGTTTGTMATPTQGDGAAPGVALTLLAALVGALAVRRWPR